MRLLLVLTLLGATWSPLGAQVEPGDEAMLAISGAVLGGLFFVIATDGGGPINRLGDGFERRVLTPIGADWFTLGSPVTWVQHGLAELAVIGAAAGLAKLFGADPRKWARRWGWAGVGAYAAREAASYAWPPPDRRGPDIACLSRTFPYASHVCDGILDVAFPLGVLWLTAR